LKFDINLLIYLPTNKVNETNNVIPEIKPASFIANGIPITPFIHKEKKFFLLNLY